MQTTPSTPTVTRRVRIAFDVDVNIQPLPEKVIRDAPGLAPFQQALLNDPVLYDRMIALEVIHHLQEHMENLYQSKEGAGWLPYPYIRVIRSAVRQMTLEQATPFLADDLLDESDQTYILPLVELFQSHQVSSLPVITDLDSGQPLDWQTSPLCSFLFCATYDEYALVRIGEENVLVLNLLQFPATWDIVENLTLAGSELERQNLDVQRVLVLIGAGKPELLPEACDAIQVYCAEAFPGRQVTISQIPSEVSEEVA
jgi:hypothetical protein